MDKIKPIGYIYKITNLLNGKVYIGQTIESNPLNRIKDHFANGTLKDPKNKNHKFYNAVRKYGKEGWIKGSKPFKRKDPNILRFKKLNINSIEEFLKIAKNYYCLKEITNRFNCSNKTIANCLKAWFGTPNFYEVFNKKRIYFNHNSK